ncbi:MAG TPA: hypothetical protein VF723_08150 [Pyrinomonadaceae bacterium]
MITLKETKQQIEREPQHWCVHLMDFVDDFRYYKDLRALSEPFSPGERRTDALLASTAEALCDELGLAPPPWLAEIPECEQPYFVGDLENLKAISIVESPLRFRIRKIFVLENFLSRV